jgi:hypothetical protein
MDPNYKNECSDLFVIRKSTINGTDYGMFTARLYSIQDILGLYLGDVYPKKKKTSKSKYALEIKWKGEQLIADARNGPCGLYVKCINIGFCIYS